MELDHQALIVFMQNRREDSILAQHSTKAMVSGSFLGLTLQFHTYLIGLFYCIHLLLDRTDR